MKSKKTAIHKLDCGLSVIREYIVGESMALLLAEVGFIVGGS